MKEYWINVYWYSGVQWLGNAFPSRELADKTLQKPIYRIHVRLK